MLKEKVEQSNSNLDSLPQQHQDTWIDYKVNYMKQKIGKIEQKLEFITQSKGKGLLDLKAKLLMLDSCLGIGLLKVKIITYI